MIFFGNLRLNMCRLVVLSMFSKVHHVELSGNKPWWCILPASLPIIQTLRPSTGLQEHHFLDWWKKSDKVLLSTWAVDIAWRYHESHLCFFGGCGSTTKITCEGCWTWESTFSNLVSNIWCAGCMVMFGELWFPQSFRAIWMIHHIQHAFAMLKPWPLLLGLKTKAHIRPRVGEPKHTKWHPWNRPQLQQATWMANCMMPWLVYTTRWLGVSFWLRFVLQNLQRYTSFAGLLVEFHEQKKIGRIVNTQTLLKIFKVYYILCSYMSQTV